MKTSEILRETIIGTKGRWKGKYMKLKDVSVIGFLIVINGICLWMWFTYEPHVVHTSVDRSKAQEQTSIEIQWVISSYGKQFFCVKGVELAKAVKAFKYLQCTASIDHDIMPGKSIPDVIPGTLSGEPMTISESQIISVIPDDGVHHTIYPFRYCTIDSKGNVSAKRGWGSRTDDKRPARAIEYVPELPQSSLKSFAEELVK